MKGVEGRERRGRREEGEERRRKEGRKGKNWKGEARKKNTFSKAQKLYNVRLGTGVMQVCSDHPETRLIVR